MRSISLQMENILKQPVFQMSLVNTIVTPFIYRNWLYEGKFGTTDKDDLYPGLDRIDR